MPEARKPPNKTIRLSGDKQTLIVKTQGKQISLKRGRGWAGSGEHL